MLVKKVILRFAITSDIYIRGETKITDQAVFVFCFYFDTYCGYVYVCYHN